MNCIDISNKILSLNSNNLSDKDRLDLLLEINKVIDNEIKSITTNGSDTYSNLLKYRIVSKILGIDCKKYIKWTPKLHNEYEKVRSYIISRIGVLGKIITKSQYEEALSILDSYIIK